MNVCEACGAEFVGHGTRCPEDTPHPRVKCNGLPLTPRLHHVLVAEGEARIMKKQIFSRLQRARTKSESATTLASEITAKSKVGGTTNWTPLVEEAQTRATEAGEKYQLLLEGATVGLETAEAKTQEAVALRAEHAQIQANIAAVREAQLARALEAARVEALLQHCFACGRTERDGCVFSNGNERCDRCLSSKARAEDANPIPHEGV